MKIRWLFLYAWLLALSGLAGCVQVAPPSEAVAPRPAAQAGSDVDRGGRVGAKPQPLQEEKQETRPGLGTAWGENRDSPVDMVKFSRANSSQPSATGKLYYNDVENVRQMAGNGYATREMITLPGGWASWGLQDEAGNLLARQQDSQGNYYVAGESGRRYAIRLQNNTNSSLEIVLAVDGLDVLDGKPATYGKPGYIVRPYGSLVVDGFRQSQDNVAAFRFSSVRESYASRKHGDTRNVGIIGLAVFHEQGSSPTAQADEETKRRQSAQPFPGNFATPP